MYSYYYQLQNVYKKSRREFFSNIDLGTSTNQLIQLVNSLNLSQSVLTAVANNPESFINQAVSFEGGTLIDTSGNIIIGPTPSLANHAVTLGYLFPGSSIMNNLLSDTISTIVLDMNTYASNTYVQNAIADAALPIANPTSMYGGGWRYVNNASAYPAIINPSTSVSNKINWYMFSNSTTNAAYAYSRFNTAFLRLSMALTSTTQAGNFPYVTVYTLPQGSGNGASWYRSKKSYTVAVDVLPVGTDVILYVGTDPRLCGFTNLHATVFINLTYQHAAITYKGPVGQTDIASNEIISLIGWGTNSVSTTGSVDMTVCEMGYSIGSGLNRLLTFY